MSAKNTHQIRQKIKLSEQKHAENLQRFNDFRLLVQQNCAFVGRDVDIVRRRRQLEVQQHKGKHVQRRERAVDFVDAAFDFRQLDRAAVDVEMLTIAAGAPTAWLGLGHIP
jgi:predicted amidophosphoribosyltransferase